MAAVDAWINAERTWRFGRDPSQVRRSLFGPIDHESNSRFLKEELDKLQDENNRRWNFDFRKEVPLHDAGKGDQRYLWTPVRRTCDDGGDDVAPKMREMEDTTPKEEDKNGGDDTELTSREISPNDVTHKSPMRQTQITDFMRKRKSSFSGHKNGITTSAEPSIKMVRRSSA